MPTAGDLADIQDTYDGVASDVGCSNASDTLACLRDVSADSLRAAASRIQNGVGYSVSLVSRNLDDVVEAASVSSCSYRIRGRRRA